MRFKPPFNIIYFKIIGPSDLLRETCKLSILVKEPFNLAKHLERVICIKLLTSNTY